MIRDNLYDLYKNLEKKDHHLLYIFLEITRDCNLSCLHCGSDCKKDDQTAVLTTESWFKIIDYIAEQFDTSPSFVITGGEPLLHPDLEAIGSYINQKNLQWGMVTNGQLLTANKLNSLIENGINSITLSLDGMEKEHNYLRNNKTSYQKVINALKAIGESSIELADVVTCVYPDNLDILFNIADTLVECGIHAWRLFRIFPNGRAKDNPGLQLTHDQTWKMINWIYDNREYYKLHGLDISLSCEGYIPFNIDKVVRDEPFFCRAGINIASILCDGTITGCSNNHNTFYEGNILTDNFKNIWENGFKNFRDKSWLNETVCHDCKYFKHCRGSSIHLWDLTKHHPNFCYCIPDIENKPFKPKKRHTHVNKV